MLVPPYTCSVFAAGHLDSRRWAGARLSMPSKGSQLERACPTLHMLVLPYTCSVFAAGHLDSRRWAGARLSMPNKGKQLERACPTLHMLVPPYTCSVFTAGHLDSRRVGPAALRRAGPPILSSGGIASLEARTSDYPSILPTSAICALAMSACQTPSELGFVHAPQGE
jgi:hypothetical protein